MREGRSDTNTNGTVAQRYLPAGPPLAVSKDERRPTCNAIWPAGTFARARPVRPAVQIGAPAASAADFGFIQHEEDKKKLKNKGHTACVLQNDADQRAVLR
jgi:hypothetical protein